MLCQYYYKTAVHKVDGPNQGQTYTSPQSGQTPPRVKLIQVHKVDGPHQGSRPVHEMDGPNLGQTYTSPPSGRTPPRAKLIQIHKVDAPNQGHKLSQVHKVDGPHQGSRPVHEIDEPTSVKTYPQSGRAQPLSTYINPRSGRTLQGVKTNPQNGRTQPGPSLSAE